jgi:dienelactone hydrolase
VSNRPDPARRATGHDTGGMRLRPHGTRRTPRLAFLVALAVAASGAGAAGCSTSPETAPGSASAVDRNPSPTTAVRGVPVTMAELPLVDTSRPVLSGGTVLAAQRNLPTFVWTPAGAGPFPLVVFVHGYDTGPLDYRRFCSTLASAGYVVAAPSFPLEDPARGYPLDETRLPDEAADVAFVITELEQGSAGRVDGSRVAVVGHSDGADVALLVGYGPGSVDPRVGAVVADAPDPMTATAVPSHVPLLLVQGTADTVVPYSSSQTVYGQVAAPVDYVSLVGADHLGPIAGRTPWTPVLDEAVARFLDATVAPRGTGGGSPLAGLSDPPLVRYESKG